MKTILFLISTLFLGLLTFAQNTPVSYSFKVKNNIGEYPKNQYLKVRISICSDINGNNVNYIEVHTTRTSESGAANIPLGEGIGVSGSWNNVNMQNQFLFAKLEIDFQDSKGFVETGIFQISINNQAKNQNTNLADNKNAEISLFPNITLTGQPGNKTQYTNNKMFYSAHNNKSYTAEEAEKSSTDIDLAFLWQTEKGYTLCSPDAVFIKELFAINFYDYNPKGKNRTKIQKINCDWSKADQKFVDNLVIKEEFLPFNKGIGVTGLQPDDIVAFETSKGKKGIIKIKPAGRTLNAVTIDVKVK